MKKIIGITGGIASGKSTVTSFLTSKGYEVIDADAVVRELQQIGGALYVAIRDTFGPTYFLADGELDRITFGQAIFANSEMRGQLSTGSCSRGSLRASTRRGGRSRGASSSAHSSPSRSSAP